MKRFIAAALLLALVPVHAEGSQPPEWFGPTGVDEGWHFRVPVTISNPYASPLHDAPVAAELDLTTLLLDAGWTGISSGGSRLLTGFELDEGSIRVVEMTNLEPLDPARPQDGRIKATVPHLVHEGLLGRTGDADRTHDASSDPVVTVYFRVPGHLEPGHERHFYVYFDAVHNGDIEAAPVPGDLESLHWSTVGTLFYGRMPAASDNILTVLGTHDGAHVEVATFQGGVFTTTGVESAHGATFDLDAGERVRVSLGAAEAPHFRIKATGAPVAAFVQAQGAVPALSGALSGHEFMFHTASDPVGKGAYFVNLGDGDARVQVHGVGEIQLAGRLQAGSYGGSHLACQSGPSWINLAAGSTYHASVIEGGPVQLHLQPLHKMQVPSLDGAPRGTQFLSTSLWSEGADCSSGLGQGFHAMAQVTGTTLRVTSLEHPVQSFPSGSAAVPEPGPATLPDDEPGGPYEMSKGRTENRDRPLLFETSGLVSLFAGGPATFDGRPHVAGPLGGADAGRQYHTLDPAAVMTLYGNTRITATLHYAHGTQQVDVTRGAGELLLLQDEPAGRLLWGTVESDRPVIVHPLNRPAGFLAGQPAFVDVTIHDLEFRGRLLALQGEGGEDPVTRSALPGGPVVYSIQIQNLGRGLDVPVQEAVQIGIESVPTGWSASLDRPEITLNEGQSETVELTVTPPEDATSGDTALVRIHATSRDNPAVGDTLDTVTFVRSTFGIGMWFLQEDNGPKTLTLSVAPGEVAQFPLIVKNLGSEPENVGLTLPHTDNAVVELLEDGQPVNRLELSGREAREFVLRVTPDAGLADGIVFTTVTGQAEHVASSRDRVTGVVRIQSPSDIALHADDPLQRVADGGEAAFALRLVNRGEGGADVRLASLGDATDWNDTRLFVVDQDKRLPIDRISLAPGEEVHLHVAQDVPPGTTAGTISSLLVTATAGAAVEERALTLVVAPRHALMVHHPAVAMLPGRETEITLPMQNAGNLDEVLRTGVLEVPAGWSVKLPDDVVALRNQTSDVPVTITPTAHAAPGVTAVVLRFTSIDGTVTEVPVLADVRLQLDGTANGTFSLQAQPGAPAPFEVPYTHGGNRPAIAWIESASDWPLHQEPVTLVPGATVTLAGEWDVPRTAPDGTTVRTATLRIEDAEGLTPTRSMELSFTLDVGRSDLRIADPTLTGSPGGDLLRIRVDNIGNRPAHDVFIQATGAGDVLATGHVRLIPAGGAADVYLALPGGLTSVVVEVDPHDTIVELDEDNRVLVERTDALQKAPFVWWAPLMVWVVARRGMRHR